MAKRAKAKPPIVATVAEKPKRGRPRVFDPETIDFVLKGSGCERKSRRAKQDYLYRVRALGALGTDRLFDERVRWIIDPQKCRAERVDALRPTVLAELGRLVDPDEIRQAALWLVEQEPRTSRMAVAFLRQYRGKNAPADV